MARPHRVIPMSHAIVMVAVAVLFVSGLAFGMVIQSERKWCELLSILETPEQPANTPRGVLIVEKIHDLRESFFC
jgi:hypothetical protein